MAFYRCGGKPEEEKTVTAGTTAKEVLPNVGKTMKKVTINPTPTQAKTVTAEMSPVTVIPDDGKYLNKVVINPPVVPKGIKVTSQPAKTSYKAGDALSLTGLVIKVEMSDGTSRDITSECTFTPASGTVIYENVKKVTATWKSGDLSYTVDIPITVTRTLSKIAVTTKPKTTYYKGDALDLTGMVVTATYNSGATEVVTTVSTNPAEGTALDYSHKTVTVSYYENGVTKTASFAITVSVKIVTWATGTDAEIADMVTAADAGIINLADYWAVGQERKVELSAMPATGVGESHVEQTVTMVLMHKGGYTLANGKTCSFVVGQKNGLTSQAGGEYGYMNPSSTNSGSWDKCQRRTWCNNIYYNAISVDLRPIFKKFKTVTIEEYSSSTLKTSEDFFALPAEKEVFGDQSYSNATEANALFQLEYYKTASNRIKKIGDKGSASGWWGRSPSANYDSYFCYVSGSGDANYIGASNAFLLAPFGCI